MLDRDRHRYGKNPAWCWDFVLGFDGCSQDFVVDILRRCRFAAADLRVAILEVCISGENVGVERGFAAEADEEIEPRARIQDAESALRGTVTFHPGRSQ